MKLKITDDDGFIAIVNGSRYESFLDEDWEFNQLLMNFVDQMKSGNIIIWQTSNEGGGNWLVSFQEHPSEAHVYRQFQQFIKVTSGELFLTNYSDLTMAAQFNDEPILASHNADLKIELANGWYKFTVSQLFDPDNMLDYLDDEREDKTAFEVIITPATEFILPQANTIPWMSH